VKKEGTTDKNLIRSGLAAEGGPSSAARRFREGTRRARIGNLASAAGSNEGVGASPPLVFRIAVHRRLIPGHRLRTVLGTELRGTVLSFVPVIRGLLSVPPQCKVFGIFSQPTYLNSKHISSRYLGKVSGKLANPAKRWPSPTRSGQHENAAISRL